MSCYWWQKPTVTALELMCELETVTARVKALEAENERLEGQVALLTVALANAEAERDSMRAAAHVSTTGTIALDAKEGTDAT